MTLTEAREIAAQCWCDRRTQSKEMDPELAEVFAETLFVHTKSEVAKRVDSVRQAREVIAKAFKDDPDFRHVYVANIACLIMDNIPGFKKDRGKREKIADKILHFMLEQ